MERAISMNVEVEGVYNMPAPGADEKEGVSDNVFVGSRCFEDTLRIEIPATARGPCPTPVSTAEITGTSTPQTAVYRPRETAFHCEAEEFSQRVDEGRRARLSASGPPQGDVLERVIHSSGWREVNRPQSNVTPTFSNSEPIHLRRRKSSISLFTSSSCKTSDNWPASGGAGSQEMSIAADRSRGGEPDGMGRTLEVVSRSSGSFEAHPALAAVIVQESSGTPSSSKRPQRSGSKLTSSPPPLPGPPRPLSDKEMGESSDSSQHGFQMDLVLCDASKIRGLRLTWLLYILIVMVIVLFVLVLVQIIYETNHTLKRSATEAVQSHAASLLNSANMHQYELDRLFGMMRNLTVAAPPSTSTMENIVHYAICTSLLRAPIAFALYNAAGEQQWRRVCTQYDSSDMSVQFPETFMPGLESVLLADSGQVVFAYRTFSDRGIPGTYMMMMDKEMFGAFLMNSRVARYSVATLQYVVAAFFVRGWNTTHPTMLFHTLTNVAPSYRDTTTSPRAAALGKMFESICRADSPYVWHTVMAPKRRSEEANLLLATDDWPATTFNPIPTPYFEYKRSWGQVSRSILCGVQCTSAKGNACAPNNPTNVWFLVDHSLTEDMATQNSVRIVGVVSIMAVVIFSFIMCLVYISITVPVNYLRYQLMRAVGCTKVETLWQRRIVRWTHRLWLGDLTSIARSIYILSLCFRLSKKYVPDHVLRNHAKRLYVRRRKLNYLEDNDVNEDTAVEDDTESENEPQPSLPPLAGVSTTHSPPSALALWRFSSLHGMDQITHTVLEGGVECHTVGVKSCGEASLAEVSPAYAWQPPPPSASHDVVTMRGRAPPPTSAAALPCDVSLSAGAYGGLEDTMGTLEASTVAAAAKKISTSGDIMNIRRDFESTVLCIRILGVQLAYLVNYSAAVRQHRRLMRVLLHRIRRHKGALFHCTGDSLGAVWNAFEGCSYHAEGAAVCAQEIANALAPYRNEGLHIGMALHQGTLVCGTVEYSTTAFVTAFGDGPREALAVAELAATVNTLNVLVTEPVKQSLSGLYDCNIVDVIQLPNISHPLLLFELSGTRAPERSQYDTPLETPLQGQFSIEYARAFAQFRNHEFSEALDSIQTLRGHSSSRNAHLLRRLERLCLFYSTQPTALPLPYHRAFPVWTNYEAIAQAGLRSDPRLVVSQTDSLVAHNRSRDVLYQGVPALRNEMDCIRDFKQELQANMRRIGPPRRVKRHRPSPTMNDFSTSAQPRPQPSLPIPPVVVLTPAAEKPPMVVDTDLSKLSTAATSTNFRYVDPLINVAGTSPPTVSSVEVLAAAMPESSRQPPLAAAVGAQAKREAPHFPEQSPSSETLSSQDLPFPAKRLSTYSIRNLPSVILPSNSDLADAPPAMVQSAAARIDSTHSTVHPEGINTSIIQSAGLSFDGTYGVQSFCANREKLPSAIKAKNGTTYLLSTRILGKGSFGCVYLGMDARSGRPIAIKFLPLPSDEMGMKVVEAEVLTLQQVNDSHVVQLLSYAFEGDNIVIFMECMLAGSLQNMISAFRTIPSSTARVFMRDILRGLSTLHSMGIIHRDMKPQNVLLSFTGNCKISDFGASAWLQELVRKESKGEVFGTPVYLAPEAARGNPEGNSDIWSCGIMFLQMITGHLPYPPEQLASGAAALVYQIGSGIAKPKIPDDLDVLDAEFVYACLDDDPAKRTSVAGLLQLALFTV